MGVTSLDVAREAGVSPTTVSFVLNGRTDQGISDATRRSVLDAVDRLGYVPSAAARSLRSGRSNVILCALPAMPATQAFEEFKERLSSLLDQRGYTCVFVHLGASTKPLSSVWRHVQPAAVAALDTLADADLKALSQAGIPALEGILDPGRPSPTSLDQELVGSLQVRHLAERGHTRIGYGVIDDPREFRFSEPRLAGARRACAELGLPAPVVARLAYSRDSAGTAIGTWLTRGDAVTGVAAFNDIVAFSILAASRTAGVRVPDDLALIGVDDLPIAALTHPALTTVRLNLDVPAELIASRVLALVNPSDHPDSPSSTRPFVELVPRETT